MDGAKLIETEQWSLASLTGYEHPLLYVNTEIVLHTWIIIALLLCALLTVKYVLKHTKVARFLLLQFITFFIDLTKQSLGQFEFAHCVFASSLFIFIALCNTASIVPWLDEPTRDINTALSLGIIVFFYIQVELIKTKGLKSYMSDYFQPFFFMLPLNIVGKLSSIISISFRLFGNIFGGSIITKLYFTAIRGSLLLELFGIFSGINFLIVIFFTIFEGLLQAFVFSMLTLTYLSMRTQEGGH